MTTLRKVIRIVALALSVWDMTERFRLLRQHDELVKKCAHLEGRLDLIEAVVSASFLKPGQNVGTSIGTSVGEIELREAGGPYEGRGFLVYLPPDVTLPDDAAKTVAEMSDNRLHLVVLPDFAREVCGGAKALVLADPNWEREGPFEPGLPGRSMLHVFGIPSLVE